MSPGGGFIVGGVFAIVLVPEIELILDNCGETGS